MAENINWLTLNPTAGTSGLTNVTMTSNACPQRMSRKAVITFKAGDNLTRKVTVVQNGSAIDYGDVLKAKKIGNITSVSATQIMINFGVASSTNPEGATYFYKVSTNATEEYAANSGWKSIHATATSITETISLSVGSEAYVHSAAVKETSSNVEHKMFTHKPQLASPTVTCVKSSNHTLKFTWNNVSNYAGYRVYTGITSTFTPSASNCVREGNSNREETINGLDLHKTYYVKVVAFATDYQDSEPGLGSGTTTNDPEIMITATQNPVAFNQTTRITFTLTGNSISNYVNEVRVNREQPNPYFFEIVNKSTSEIVHEDGKIKNLFSNGRTSDWIEIKNVYGVNSSYSIEFKGHIYSGTTEVFADSQIALNLVLNGNTQAEPSSTLMVYVVGENGSMTQLQNNSQLSSFNGQSTAYTLHIVAYGGSGSVCSLSFSGGTIASVVPSSFNSSTEGGSEDVTLTINQAVGSEPEYDTLTISVDGGSYPKIDFTIGIVKSGIPETSHVFTVSDNGLLTIPGTLRFMGEGNLSKGSLYVTSDLDWKIYPKASDVDWITNILVNNIEYKSNYNTYITSGNSIEILFKAQEGIMSEREVVYVLEQRNTSVKKEVTVHQNVAWQSNGEFIVSVGFEILEEGVSEEGIDSTTGLLKVQFPQNPDDNNSTLYTHYTLHVQSNAPAKFEIERKDTDPFYIYFDSGLTSTASSIYFDTDYNVDIYVKDLTEQGIQRTNMIKVYCADGTKDSNNTLVFKSAYEFPNGTGTRVGGFEGMQSSVFADPKLYVGVFTTAPNSSYPACLNSGFCENNELFNKASFNTSLGNGPASCYVVIYAEGSTTIEMSEAMDSKASFWNENGWTDPFDKRTTTTTGCAYTGVNGSICIHFTGLGATQSSSVMQTTYTLTTKLDDIAGIPIEVGLVVSNPNYQEPPVVTPGNDGGVGVTNFTLLCNNVPYESGMITDNEWSFNITVDYLSPKRNVNSYTNLLQFNIIVVITDSENTIFFGKNSYMIDNTATTMSEVGLHGYQEELNITLNNVGINSDYFNQNGTIEVYYKSYDVNTLSNYNLPETSPAGTSLDEYEQYLTDFDAEEDQKYHPVFDETQGSAEHEIWDKISDGNFNPVNGTTINDIKNAGYQKINRYWSGSSLTKITDNAIMTLHNLFN